MRIDSVEELFTNNPDLAAANQANCGDITLKTNKTELDLLHTHKKGSVREADWQRTVIEAARRHGWKVCEFRKARVKRGGVDVYRTPFGADGVGFPDLLMVRPPRVLVVENKSENGKISPEQMDWLLQLGGCPGIEVRVLKPSDNLDEVLE